jgi:hypothetical protein
MNAYIARKSQTGEPTGNGGHFGSVTRSESSVALAASRKQPGTYSQIQEQGWLDRSYAIDVNDATGLTDDQFKTTTHDYLTAALWTGIDEGGTPLDSMYDAHNFSRSARARAESDIVKFLSDNKALVAEALTAPGYGADSPEGAPGQLGHDFWLTRNGAGAGFWDRDELSGELGRKLTDAAKRAGEVNVYAENGRVDFE